MRARRGGWDASDARSAVASLAAARRLIRQLEADPSASAPSALHGRLHLGVRCEWQNGAFWDSFEMLRTRCALPIAGRPETVFAGSEKEREEEGWGEREKVSGKEFVNWKKRQGMGVVLILLSRPLSRPVGLTLVSRGSCDPDTDGVVDAAGPDTRDTTTSALLDMNNYDAGFFVDKKALFHEIWAAVNNMLCAGGQCHGQGCSVQCRVLRISDPGTGASWMLISHNAASKGVFDSPQTGATWKSTRYSYLLAAEAPTAARSTRTGAYNGAAAVWDLPPGGCLRTASKGNT